MSKVAPGTLEVAGPLAEDAINNCAQVELGAKSVEHRATIDARGGEGGLVNLKGVGTLRRLHCQVDNGVELDGYLVNLDGLKGPGDEHKCLRMGGTRHVDGRVKATQRQQQ